MKRNRERKPNRLPGYDYSGSGYYFVTICTKNKIDYFGRIKSGKILLSEIGHFATEYWLEIPRHFEAISIGEYVIMPNHIHGIVGIESVGNANLRSLPDRSKMLLSKAIQQYKSAVTRKIRNNYREHPFGWQKSFHDHIIRNDIALYRIRKYIQNNPLKWEYDQENDNHLSRQEKKKFWNKFLQ